MGLLKQHRTNQTKRERDHSYVCIIAASVQGHPLPPDNQPLWCPKADDPSVQEHVGSTE